MHVIVDVRRKKGRLPPTLQIQADNCTQEDKNINMFRYLCSSCGVGVLPGGTIMFSYSGAYA
jgi:hypothetical protein